VRYVIAKSITSETRLERQRNFITRSANRYWQERSGKRIAMPELFKLLPWLAQPYRRYPSRSAKTSMK